MSDSIPRAKEVRREQNRRAWQKKRNRELLMKDPPALPDHVYEEATAEMSQVDHARIFKQFCEGRDSLGIGNVDVGEDDFDALIGPSPYPASLTSHSGFFRDWPILCAALHGVMARRYLSYCDQLIHRCLQFPDTHIITGLHATHQDLIVSYNRVTVGARRLFALGDKVGVVIATHNKRWIARVLVYTAEDMVALREGCSNLVRTLSDRKWKIGYVRPVVSE